jgi:hypothetical protein
VLTTWANGTVCEIGTSTIPTMPRQCPVYWGEKATSPSKSTIPMRGSDRCAGARVPSADGGTSTSRGSEATPYHEEQSRPARTCSNRDALPTGVLSSTSKALRSPR